MDDWLRDMTRVQFNALVFLFGVLVRWGLALIFGWNSLTSLVIIASLFVLFAFRKPLLWRVRNRLFLTFFLFGVVPILLIGLMLVLLVELALGQIAVQRVHQGLDAQLKLLESVARNPSVSPGIVPREITGVNAVADLRISPVDFAGVIERGSMYYLAAQGSAGLVSIPLDDEIIKAVTGGSVSLGTVVPDEEDIDVKFNPSGAKVSTGPKDNRKEVPVLRLSPPKAFWDVPVAGILRQDVYESDKDASLVLLTRVSSLTAGLASDTWVQITLIVLAFVGSFLLIVELISLVLSVRLTRTITRSVHDLHRGTQRIAAGDFSHQIPVRGDHQLSDLAASFNGMTSKIQHYIGEMRKKDKLEAEIEIARQVQARLFPRTVPKLRTLEMAGVCLPGRFISGDYYDFVKLDDHHTAIALGDVSGKGVSAALLMASIQSALHTQLRFSGTDQNPSLSTATLMALISQQLYESTPPEKYATFFCSVYDDDTGLLHYTNCGHLRPILIRSGKPETLPGDGMVVGLLPNVHYEQHELQTQPGDLIAIFSDGIPEAENAAGKEFGEDRLAELLARSRTKPLEETIQASIAAVRAWVHDPEGQDDTTIVLLRRL